MVYSYATQYLMQRYTYLIIFHKKYVGIGNCLDMNTFLLGASRQTYTKLCNYIFYKNFLKIDWPIPLHCNLKV